MSNLKKCIYLVSQVIDKGIFKKGQISSSRSQDQIFAYGWKCFDVRNAHLMY